MSVLLNRVVSSQHVDIVIKRWLATFAEQPSPAALQVVAEDLGERMRCSDAVMGSVTNADSFESAPVAAARERMLTRG